jgi:hypothetical protein
MRADYNDHMITSFLKEINLDTNKNNYNTFCMGVRTRLLFEERI